MYQVTWLTANEQNRHSLVVFERHILLDVVLMMEESPRVDQYKVTDEETALEPKSFGFGGLHKWVTKFSYH